MYHPPRERLLVRHRGKLLLAGLLALAVALWLVIELWRPLPPRSFVMATGPEGGAYAAVAERYRDILARDGIRLELRPTEGTAENLALLRDPASGVKAAFVLGGTVPAVAGADLVSLGTMFYEPLWLFCRCAPGATIADLKGLRLSIGEPGSGGHQVALRLLQLNGMQPGDFRLLELPPAASADGLAAGELDAVFITAAWETPAVRQMLSMPGVALLGFPRADAYVALYPALTRLVLPMGVADLASNRPPADVTLIATQALLVVRGDLHPALQLLLIGAAEEIHAPPAIFHEAGAFPAATTVDLLLSEAARQYYLNGPSFLQRNMPFWIGQILQRLLLVLAPLLGLLYPLLSGLPRLYRWQMQHRIYRLYGELKWLERELHDAPAGAARDEMLARLAALEEHVLAMRLPNAYGEMGYTLKMHVRNLRAAYGTPPPGA